MGQIRAPPTPFVRKLPRQLVDFNLILACLLHCILGEAISIYHIRNMIFKLASIEVPHNLFVDLILSKTEIAKKKVSYVASDMF